MTQLDDVPLLHPDDLYLRTKGVTPLPPLPTVAEMLAEIEVHVVEVHGEAPQLTWADIEAGIAARGPMVVDGEVLHGAHPVPAKAVVPRKPRPRR